MKLTPEQLEVVLGEYRKMHYSELNSNDFAFLKENNIINGCGGAGKDVKNRFIKWVISFVMKRLRIIFVEASCNIHDFSYWKGGTEENRKKADIGFFKAIISDIDKYDAGTIKYTIYALIFYYAVKLGGKSYFNYQ